MKGALRWAVAAGSDTRWGRLLRNLVRWGIPLLLLGLVGYALTRLGWTQIYAARPASWISSMARHASALPARWSVPIADHGQGAWIR